MSDQSRHIAAPSREQSMRETAFDESYRNHESVSVVQHPTAPVYVIRDPEDDAEVHLPAEGLPKFVRELAALLPTQDRINILEDLCRDWGMNRARASRAVEDGYCGERAEVFASPTSMTAASRLAIATELVNHDLVGPNEYARILATGKTSESGPGISGWLEANAGNSRWFCAIHQTETTKTPCAGCEADKQTTPCDEDLLCADE